MRELQLGRMCLWVLTACLGVVPIQPNYAYYPVINGNIVTNGVPPPIVVPTTPPPTLPPLTPAPTPPPTTLPPPTIPPPTTPPPTTPPPTTPPPTTPPPTTPPPTTPPPTTPPPTTPPPTTPPPTTPPPTTPPPTAPPPTTPRPTPFPLIDPRSGTQSPLKLMETELVRFGADYQDVVIESADSGGTIIFPRNRRAITTTRRSKRQTNCGCFTASLCPSASTTPAPNTDGTGLIDFRIVSVANNVQQCINGLKYCCLSTSQPQQSCGARLQTSIIYPTQVGQAKYGDYPWMVVILTNDNMYIGGGVLIDLQHILTTAHRISNYPSGTGLKIRLGEWDASGNYEQYPYRDFSIAKVWIHESYNPNTLQNDVALIRMTGGVPTGTPAVIPVCLPSPAQVFDGQRCWVAGWGKDAFGVTGQYQTVLKTVDVPILPSAGCETTLRTTRLGTAYVLDRAAFICAGGEANKDACTGDGGSGLVCETSPGRWTLAGLVAWGLGCAAQGIPAAYVNIVNYLPWIQARQAS